MSNLSRRELGQLLFGSLTLAAVPRMARARGLARRSGRGPRKLVQIILPGGSDVLYSVDPKLPREVKVGIGPVFAAKDLTTHGDIRLAPNWKSVERHLPKLVVINGIKVDTVAHPTGMLQAQQLRRDVALPTSETALTLAGSILAPESAVHCIQLGAAEVPQVPTEGRCLVDDTTVTLLGRLNAIANAPALYDAATAELATRARGAKDDGDSFRAIEHLLRAMRGKPAPQAPEIAIDAATYPAYKPIRYFAETTREQALQFEWALYALEHDLSPTVCLQSVYPWDTHAENASLQGLFNTYFAQLLASFLDRLAKLEGGSDVGLVFLSGEFGRFPYTNGTRGKDHFPQLSAILAGPGLRPGGFGRTDDEMVSARIDLSTGKARPGAAAMTEDDLGCTMFEWIGASASELGYRGRPLEFCLA